MPTFMVERYLPGVGCGELADAVRRAARAAAEMTRQGVPVSYLGSTFVPAEESCFCRFEGRDATAVEEANRRAGVPFWRVVEAVLLDGSPERDAERPARH